MTSLLPNPVRIDAIWLDRLPDDLYVPPEAFAILLDRFEGPLDFLLYLVKKNGFDLRQIDIAPIANQYIAYINLMQQVDVELAADYLVMAALLADIKSRLLLPTVRQVELEDDPRHTLLARLARYADLKAAAQQLQQADILGRDRFLTAVARPPELGGSLEIFSADLLHQAILGLLKRPVLVSHDIPAEAVHLAERIAAVQQALATGRPVCFTALLVARQGRIGVVVTLLAVLELLRQGDIRILDDELRQTLSHVDDVIPPLRLIHCTGASADVSIA